MQLEPPTGRRASSQPLSSPRPTSTSGPTGDERRRQLDRPVARPVSHRLAARRGDMAWGCLYAGARITEHVRAEIRRVVAAGSGALPRGRLVQLRSATDRAGLAEELATLRRLATVLAQQRSPQEVSTAVTDAVGPLLGAEVAAIHAFPGDGAATTIAGWSATRQMLPIGTGLPLDGGSVAARIFQTGAPAADRAPRPPTSASQRARGRTAHRAPRRGGTRRSCSPRRAMGPISAAWCATGELAASSTRPSSRARRCAASSVDPAAARGVGSASLREA